MKNAVVNTSSEKGVLTTAFFLLLLEKEYRQRCFYLNQKRFNSESMLECFSLRFSEPPKV